MCFYAAGTLVMFAAIFLQSIKFVAMYGNDIVAPILLAAPIVVGLVVLVVLSVLQRDMKLLERRHIRPTEVDFGGLNGATAEEEAVTRQTEERKTGPTDDDDALDM
jgi:hypothetical protein